MLGPARQPQNAAQADGHSGGWPHGGFGNRLVDRVPRPTNRSSKRTSPMRVIFHGTRGSIAVPGQSTLRYGGNTACVEVRSAAGTLIVIDSGTGAFGLGQSLMDPSASPGIARRGHLLITHTHWDHIQ